LVLGRRAKDKSRAADTLVQPGITLRQPFSKHPRPAPGTGKRRNASLSPPIKAAAAATVFLEMGGAYSAALLGPEPSAEPVVPREQAKT
jgi:hypothetical protein